ncbi:VRR-NUC domain-containing protein [Campylobacter sp. RM9337]|uniref:VRR-NUC domain-containing protein n=1 Tax=Campylobacter californiensis TaxID=1032243 RepID=A0AAW3ZV61_9BACT|nr:VRR-NUC domain-containing protein [Campylobacter sp. RM9337]MBE3608762.1 VRR-NUC domain-containing protein [Campylobacter sp. RM9337]
MPRYEQTVAHLKASGAVPYEEQEQMALVKWLQAKRIKHIHVANERMASVQYKKKLKALGTYAGFPDMMIFLPHRILYIEMKRASKSQSRVSKEQKEWIEFLNMLDEGCAMVVLWRRRSDRLRARTNEVAKITEQAKKLIIADFHTGKFSQRELAKKHNVSKTMVANLTKGLSPKNDHLVEAQVSLLSAQAILSIEEMTAVMTAAKDEIYNKGLVINATQLNLARITQHLDKNTKFEKVGVGDGVQNFEPVELNASDYKALQYAIDKASLTLGVNPRNSTQINNTNAQQSSETKIVIERKELKGE